MTSIADFVVSSRKLKEKGEMDAGGAAQTGARRSVACLSCIVNILLKALSGYETLRTFELR